MSGVTISTPALMLARFYSHLPPPAWTANYNSGAVATFGLQRLLLIQIMRPARPIVNEFSHKVVRFGRVQGAIRTTPGHSTALMNCDCAARAGHSSGFFNSVPPFCARPSFRPAESSTIKTGTGKT